MRILSDEKSWWRHNVMTCWRHFYVKIGVFALFPAESPQISPQCIIYGQMNGKFGCADPWRDRVMTSIVSWRQSLREAFLGSSTLDFSCFMCQNFFRARREARLCYIIIHLGGGGPDFVLSADADGFKVGPPGQGINNLRSSCLYSSWL